jgi:hypothetical protein
LGRVLNTAKLRQKAAIPRSEPVGNITFEIGDEAPSARANRGFHSKQHNFSLVFALSNCADKNN